MVLTFYEGRKQQQNLALIKLLILKFIGYLNDVRIFEKNHIFSTGY